MPEGDTIFRAATALRKALVGARVTGFRGNLRRAPLGERIEEVTARGKNLLVRFEKGRTLRTHMMLHGSWHIYREGERWRRPAFQARLELHADNGFVAVCFNAPVVEWLKPGTIEELGPDATTDAFDGEEARRRLRQMGGASLERALLAQWACPASATSSSARPCSSSASIRSAPWPPSRTARSIRSSTVRIASWCATGRPGRGIPATPSAVRGCGSTAVPAGPASSVAIPSASRRRSGSRTTARDARSDRRPDSMGSVEDLLSWGVFLR